MKRWLRSGLEYRKAGGIVLISDAWLDAFILSQDPASKQQAKKRHIKDRFLDDLKNKFRGAPG